MMAKAEKGLEDLINEMHRSPYGKIAYELEWGWEQRVMEKITGLSGREIFALDLGEIFAFEFGLLDKAKREKMRERIIFELKNRISQGAATAEEYIFMSSREENPQERQKYFEKGLNLLEKRNPRGVEALLLVQIYRHKTLMESEDVRLNYLNKAQKIIHQNLPLAQGALGVDEFRIVYHDLQKANEDPMVLEKLGRYNEKQALAIHWYDATISVYRQKANIYEKLDLPRKAREEYLYLCQTLKWDEACKNAERLKK